MKRIAAALICGLFLLSAAACGAPPPETPAAPAVQTVTDCAGQTLEFSQPLQRVVGLSSSMAEIWLLAGGTLAGTTEDAIGERHMDVGDAVSVGTIKKPAAEAILALDPDLVVYSVDIESHLEMAVLLGQGGVACDILSDVGAVNVANGSDALQKLSLEAIVAADPDYIFAVTMGMRRRPRRSWIALSGKIPPGTASPPFKTGGFTCCPRNCSTTSPTSNGGTPMRICCKSCGRTSIRLP